MIKNSTELAEIISTRISHDLIGNIGALSGALELMKESGNQLDDDTRGIITTATNTLKIRQTFFRIAFGLDTKNITTAELQKICEDYLSTVGSRLYPMTLKLNGISAELTKVFCLCVMIGAEICIRGGHIDISVNKSNLTISVTSEYDLSSSKISVYQNILQNIRPQDNISQYVQLIYLREILGHDVAMKMTTSAKSATLIIG